MLIFTDPEENSIMAEVYKGDLILEMEDIFNGQFIAVTFDSVTKFEKFFQKVAEFARENKVKETKELTEWIEENNETIDVRKLNDVNNPNFVLESAKPPWERSFSCIGCAHSQILPPDDSTNDRIQFCKKVKMKIPVIPVICKFFNLYELGESE